MFLRGKNNKIKYIFCDVKGEMVQGWSSRGLVLEGNLYSLGPFHQFSRFNLSAPACPFITARRPASRPSWKSFVRLQSITPFRSALSCPLVTTTAERMSGLTRRHLWPGGFTWSLRPFGLQPLVVPPLVESCGRCHQIDTQIESGRPWTTTTTTTTNEAINHVHRTDGGCPRRGKGQINGRSV